MAQEDGIASSHEDGACVHHWVIDAENLGVCKKCGSTRRFRGWWDVSAIRRGWARSQDSSGGDTTPKSQ